jgi:hypothetical protein
MAGQGAHISFGREALVKTSDLIRRDGLARKFRVTGEKTLRLALAFFGFERAGAIDQASADFQQACGLVEKACLQP